MTSTSVCRHFGRNIRLGSPALLIVATSTSAPASARQRHRGDAVRVRQIIAANFSKRAAAVGMRRANRSLEAALRQYQIVERRQSCAPAVRLMKHEIPRVGSEPPRQLAHGIRSPRPRLVAMRQRVDRAFPWRGFLDSRIHDVVLHRNGDCQTLIPPTPRGKAALLI